MGVHARSDDVQVPDQAQAPAGGQARGILRKVLRRHGGFAVRQAPAEAEARRRTPRRAAQPDPHRQGSAQEDQRGGGGSMGGEVHPRNPVPRRVRVAPPDDRVCRSVRAGSGHDLSAGLRRARVRGLVLDRRETRGPGERIRARAHHGGARRTSGGIERRPRRRRQNRKGSNPQQVSRTRGDHRRLARPRVRQRHDSPAAGDPQLRQRGTRA